MRNHDITSDKRALTMQEAAQYACVGRTTIEKWIINGLLPCEELPGRGDGKYHFRRIRKDDLDEFLDKIYCSQRSTEKEETDSKLIILTQNS